VENTEGKRRTTNSVNHTNIQTLPAQIFIGRILQWKTRVWKGSNKQEKQESRYDIHLPTPVSRENSQFKSHRSSLCLGGLWKTSLHFLIERFQSCKQLNRIRSWKSFNWRNCLYDHFTCQEKCRKIIEKDDQGYSCYCPTLRWFRLSIILERCTWDCWY